MGISTNCFGKYMGKTLVAHMSVFFFIAYTEVNGYLEMKYLPNNYEALFLKENWLRC